MTPREAALLYLSGKSLIPVHEQGTGIAPANIALVKYWGKRNHSLNLPLNSSLSLSMGNQGAFTNLSLDPDKRDHVYLNGNAVDSESIFVGKIREFLDWMAPEKGGRPGIIVDTRLTIPAAAGLASSAAGFAALVLALNQLCGWNCTKDDLSRLARLGSGSASRSMWHGFVEWNRGGREDGQDSVGRSLPFHIPGLRLGILVFREEAKKVSSRAGMNHTVNTSPLYKSWPETAEADLVQMKMALQRKDFQQIGELAEANALAMHATMMAARPSLVYGVPRTFEAMESIWQMRKDGVGVWFTQDAGPNLKLLFLEPDREKVVSCFPDIRIIDPQAPLQ